MLFNLYANDIVNGTMKSMSVAFTDDTSLFFRSSIITRLAKIAYRDLSKIYKWSKMNSLSINTYSKKLKPSSLSQEISLWNGNGNSMVIGILNKFNSFLPRT